MAFLQVKNNLGDIHNICDAQNNLGLLNMAYQCKCNVDIQDGSIRVSSFRLNDTNVRSNFVLVAGNDLGDVVWKEQIIQPWMTQSPSDILLSSLSNDQNFIKSEEVNVSISNYIETFRDTLIDKNLRTSNVTVSNLVVDSSFMFQDGTFVLDEPCVLTNNGYGSNVHWSKIVQSYSNDESSNVVSAQAVSNLHNIVNELVQRLPEDNGDFLISNKNLSDILSSNVAVANLGLNDNFHTENITLSNVFFQESSRPANAVAGQKYYMMRNDEDKLEYYDQRFIHNFTDSYRDYPPSSSNVNSLYLTLNASIDDRLITSNVLNEFFVGENNPYTDIFRDRLRQAGVQEVAFTSNWEDLGNRPKKLSGFLNLDFQDETMFIYAKCNLSDINNPDQALINLGVSKVGRTGHFGDLVLPISIANIVSASNFLDGILGIPFLVRTCNLEELIQDAGKARSNLGIRSMATFESCNVSITGGDITISDCIIKSNLMILASNDSLEDASIEGSNIFLKCNSSDGNARWTYLPEATSEPDQSQGIVYITNDLANPSSNTAITSYAISNAFYNNDNISNLVPLAAHDKFGIVKTTSEYINPSLLGHVVVDSIGIQTMYEELSDSITTLSDFTIPLIHSKLTDISVSNYLPNFSFLQLNNVDVDLEKRKEVSLNFPGLANDYLCSDGTFKTIKNISVSNYTYFPLLQLNAIIEDDVDVMQLSLTFTGDANDYLCADGTFKTIKNISIVNHVNYPFLQLNPRVENDIDVMQVSLLFPDDPFRYLCGDGSFKVVTPTRLLYDGSSVSNDIQLRSQNGNLSINSVDNSITFNNIALNAVNTAFFSVKTIGTWKELDTIKGAIVGQKSDRLTGTSNQYLKCVGDDEYDFVEIDLEPFTAVSQGLVPQPPLGEECVLIKTGWENKTNFMNNWLNEFNEFQKGVVVPFTSTSTDKENNFLNAKGTWTNKRDIVDINSFADKFTVSATSVGVLKIELDTTNDISKIQFGLEKFVGDAGGDLNPDHKVISYRNSRFLWESPITVLRDHSGFDDGPNSSSRYLNAEGNFISPPSAFDFTARMTLVGCNLKIEQTLNDDIPTEAQLTEVVITHTNIDGLYDNYVHKNDGIIYFNSNTNQYIKNNGNGASTTIGAGTFNDVKINIINDATFKDLAFTTSGTSKLIELFIENFKESDGNTNTFDEEHFFTTKAIQTYLESYYIEQSKIFENASLIDYTSDNTKVVSVGALNEYINTTKVFGEQLSFLDNEDKLVRAKNVTWYLEELRTDNADSVMDFSTSNDVKFTTPYAVSTYMNTNYIKKVNIISEGNDVDRVNPNNSNNVVSISGLSNYINTTKVFDYRDSLDIIDTNVDKLLRLGNMIDYFDDNRSAGTTIDFNEDVNFITPYAVSNYVNTNYINKVNIITDGASVDINNINDSNNVLSISGLSNYINTTKVFDYIDFSDVNSNKLLRFGNMKAYFNDNRFSDSITTIDLTNNVKFVTPFSMDSHLVATYIKKSELFLSDDNMSDVDNNTNENRVVTSGMLRKYINITKVYDDDRLLSDTSTVDKLVRHKNVVKYINDLTTDSLVSINEFTTNDTTFTTPMAVDAYIDSKMEALRLTGAQLSASPLLVTDDERFVTANAINQLVGTEFLGVNDRINNRLTTNFTTEDLGKLIYAENLVGYFDSKRTEQFTNQTTNTINFTTPKAVSDFVEANYVNNDIKYDYSDNNPIDNISTSSYDAKVVTVGALRNLIYNGSQITFPTSGIVGGIIQTSSNEFIDTKAMSSKAVQDYTEATYVTLDMIDNNFDLVDEYTQVPSVSYLGSNFLKINDISDIDTTVLLGLDKIKPTLPDYSSIIDEPTLYKVLTNSYKKINTISGSVDTPIFSFNDGVHVNPWQVEDHNDNDLNNNCIPTVGLMENRIISIVDNKLSAGEFTANDLVCANLHVTETMKFTFDNLHRQEAVAENNFMTINTDGEVIFKKVDHIAGSDFNNTRPEDTYSMTTGIYSQSFNEYQFIVGAYNSSNSIYDRIPFTLPNPTNQVYFAVGVGTGTVDDINTPDETFTSVERQNGFEVHNTGEVYVRSNLILGNNWRLSFDDDSLSIEKFVGGVYIQKHIFR
jgi:hypothetical protein